MGLKKIIYSNLMFAYIYIYIYSVVLTEFAFGCSVRFS